VPAFLLTVTLGETLGLFQKIFIYLTAFKNRFLTPYKTMINYGEEQLFGFEINLKIKPGKG
jgi:hypothetical protein